MKVDKSCGFHVHHDINDFENKNLFALFGMVAKWQPVLDRLVAPSRRDNRYCRPLLHSTTSSAHEHVQRLRRMGSTFRTFGMDAIWNTYNDDRYMVLNAQHYLDRGTIEFRQHQGTIDADKIAWWVILTQNIVDHAANAKAAVFTASSSVLCLKRFRDFLGCTGKYVQRHPAVLAAAKMTTERFNKFNPTLSAYAPVLA
jgi:hypothetical protein